jgi:xanthine dehydrogenase YagT iron-sulfur-binding subunit
MTKKKDTESKPAGEGISRRGFITSMGAGAVAVASIKGAAAEKVAAAEETVTVDLKINGRVNRITIEPRYTLLYVIREMLGMVATKIGCERGECGACTVLINGKPQYACMTLAVEAEGAEITTLEGLMDGEELGTVQQAFLEEDAYQCGFCTPGQVVAMEGMLRENQNPTPEEIQEGMSGNICRCGAYKHIFNAAENAADKLKNGGGK